MRGNRQIRKIINAPKFAPGFRSGAGDTRQPPEQAEKTLKTQPGKRLVWRGKRNPLFRFDRLVQTQLGLISRQLAPLRSMAVHLLKLGSAPPAGQP